MFLTYILLIAVIAIALEIQAYYQKGQIALKPVPVRITDSRNPNYPNGRYFK